MSIRKHTAYNFFGAMLPAIVSLITIPVYLSIIGEERYGVMAVAWLLLGYFGLFDLGLGRATAQRIATFDEDHSQDIALTFWTALAVNGVLGLIGGVVIWPAATLFFGNVFSLDESLRSELSAAIPWLVMAVPLMTIAGVLTGALQGRSQFLELNIISALSSMMIQLFPLFIAWMHGPELTWLIPAVILARIIALAMLFFRCHAHVFGGYRPAVSRLIAKNLVRFGGWITVSSIISPLMDTLDRFIIGALLGAKSVTFYIVPFQLASRSAILSGALASALFPRFAYADELKRKNLAIDAVRMLAVVMTPIILVGVFLIEPFLAWWLSPEFAAQSALTARILLLGFWINGIAQVPYAQLQAAGRPQIVAALHASELVPYLILLFAGLHFWGIPGAAVAFGLRTLADTALLSLFAGTFKPNILTLYIPAILLLIGFFVQLLSSQQDIMYLISAATLGLAIIWSWENRKPN